MNRDIKDSDKSGLEKIFAHQYSSVKRLVSKTYNSFVNFNKKIIHKK